MPVKVGVLTFVMLSLDEDPLSVAAVMTGAMLVETIVSIVTNSGSPVVILPNPSVALAVMEWTSSVSGIVSGAVTQSPVALAVAVAINVGFAPSNSSIVAPGSAVPWNTGVLTLVRSSVFVPGRTVFGETLSLAAARSMVVAES